MENKNIFEGAKFGDKFVTQNGTTVVLTHVMKEMIRMVSEDGKCFGVTFEGKAISPTYACDYDITSRYHVPIDEEELNKIAYEYAYNQDGWEDVPEERAKAFITGYRKATEK